DGSLLLGREGAHSRNRILHARGDATGEEIAEVLAARATEIPAIRIREHHHVLDLVVDQGRCNGAAAVDASGALRRFLARAVVLATGGRGQVYRHTTNPAGATGDGHAVAPPHGRPPTFGPQRSRPSGSGSSTTSWTWWWTRAAASGRPRWMPQGSCASSWPGRS